MAPMAADGFKATNRAPVKAHERMMARKGGMEHDPTAQPGMEADKSDRPVMTHHHEDGTHTTVHESGMEHNHENLEALKQHLDQFIDEEAKEPSEEGEMGKPEYE